MSSDSIENPHGLKFNDDYGEMRVTTASGATPMAMIILSKARRK